MSAPGPERSLAWQPNTTAGLGCMRLGDRARRGAPGHEGHGSGRPRPGLAAYVAETPKAWALSSVGPVACEDATPEPAPSRCLKYANPLRRGALALLIGCTSSPARRR